MPGVSDADLLMDWQHLLDRMGASEPDLDLEPLSRALKELRELRDYQKGLAGARRKLAERQREVREQGKAQARHLKGRLARHSPAIPAPTEILSTGTRAAKLKDWHHLLAALQENRRELPHLEAHRAQLEALLHQMEELVQAKAVLTSLKHGSTKRLSTLLVDCARLATVLRFALKQHYGLTADKLEDFGIQPRKPAKPVA